VSWIYLQGTYFLRQIVAVPVLQSPIAGDTTKRCKKYFELKCQLAAIVTQKRRRTA